MALAGLESVSPGAPCCASRAVGSKEAGEWDLQMESWLEEGGCLIIHQPGGMSM